LGQSKTDSAGETLAGLNPELIFQAHTERLTSDNGWDIIRHYDLVVDGCDNFETRFLVNDLCYFAQVPLVSGAVGEFQGQVSTFKGYETDAEGTPYPTYRCLVPQAPPTGAIPTCAEAGVLGALTGVIGSMQALEAIKEITGAGSGLAGKLVIYDALDARFRTIKLPWDPANPLNGTAPSIHAPA
jgi:adenylyltransferase/sulfurtransferase